jgi:hypothetical protein
MDLHSYALADAIHILAIAGWLALFALGGIIALGLFAWLIED